MGAICVSLLPHNCECTYVQHLAEYLWTYFSEDTGIPVYWTCHFSPNQIYSNITISIISSWSDICNICPTFCLECGGNSSTSFFKIGLYEIKRQESTRLQTFLFCVVQIEIASPTACDQGQNLSRGFMSVLGASLNLEYWCLKKEMSNILLYSSYVLTYKYTCEYFCLHDLQHIWILRCYECNVSYARYIRRTVSWNLKSKPKLGRNAFWVSVVDCFQARSSVCCLGCFLSREGFVCISVMTAFLHKRFIWFYMFQVDISLFIYLHLIHT